MPDDDLAAEMYEMAEEVLDTAGYEQYEISNWARKRDWRPEIRDWCLADEISVLPYSDGIDPFPE